MYRIGCRNFERGSTSRYSSIYGHRFHRWFYLQFAAARFFARGAASFAPLANFTTYLVGAWDFLGPKAPLIGPVRVGACMISNHIKCHIDGQDQNGRKH